MFLTDTATKSLVFQTPDPFRIRDLIPQSRSLTGAGGYNVACKHTTENVRVLRNIGIEAPIPPYDWPGKFIPMDHQKVMVDFHVTHPRGFNLSEMGTSKTAAVLWAADILMKEGRVKKCAIFSPLSTLEIVWMQEIFDVLMHRRAVVVHGSREQRAAAMSRDVDFYVINHDGLCISEVSKPIHRRADINLIVVDEGAKFRNDHTDMYKELVKMVRPDQMLWWMTGAPCPNGPTDAWAQAKIISPHLVPKFAGAFKRKTMMQVSKFKWVPKLGASEIAYSAMQPAVRFKKSECIDLPPVTTVRLQATLSAEQRAAFKEMKNTMKTELGDRQLTAVNAADKINKLRQLLCGSVRDTTKEKDEYITIPHGPRFEALREAIDGASSKVLVIVPFKGIIEDLAKELRVHYTVGVINGDVSPGQRNRIITEFKTSPDPHLLLCHPKVMAHGLNLTEADTLIFYAPIYSNDDFGQVVERFNRKGQTRKMTIVRIAAHPMEWEIYKMIDVAQVTQASMLSLYKTAMSE